MQVNRISFLFILVLMGFSSFSNLALTQEDSTSKDTSVYCFKYKFNPNDTLVFLVHSYDSIVIDYGKPLLKVRSEIHQVVCEGISKNGDFILKYKLLAFEGRDIQDTSIIQYNDSDWLNREIRIEIDSFGNRKNFWCDDTTISGRTPGGPFQPRLFFPFQENCKKPNETWLVRATEDLAENGIPIPRLRHTMLFKMLGEVDTLGEKVVRSEFIQTGQGFLRLSNPAGELTISAIINSYGFLDVSKDKMIPIHLFTTVEQKLTFDSNDTESTGRHYIYCNFTLVDYKKGPPEKKIPTSKGKIKK
ncbi:MAG: hypothetical protein ACK42Z_08135 [Candidatus Kapaibacteriota bacterium]